MPLNRAYHVNKLKQTVIPTLESNDLILYLNFESYNNHYTIINLYSTPFFQGYQNIFHSHHIFFTVS